MSGKYFFFISLIICYTLFINLAAATCDACFSSIPNVCTVSRPSDVLAGTEQLIGDCGYGSCTSCQEQNSYVYEIGGKLVKYWYVSYATLGPFFPALPGGQVYNCQCKGTVGYRCGMTCVKDMANKPSPFSWPCPDLNRLICDMYCKDEACTSGCFCSDAIYCCPSSQVCQGGSCVATPACTVTAWGCTDSVTSYPARCEGNKIITYQCVAGYCQPVETICPVDQICNPTTLNCEIPPPPPECDDSDKSVSGNMAYGTPGKCTDKGACAAGCKDACAGSTLTEWYCSGNDCKSTAYSCPTGKCYTYDGKGYCGEIMNCKYNICTSTLTACGDNCIQKCTAPGCNPILFPIGATDYACPSYGECYPSTSWMCCSGACLGCLEGTTPCCSTSGGNPHCCKTTEICLDSGNCDEVCNNLAYSRFSDPYCSKCEHCKDGLLNCGENPTAIAVPQGCPNAGSLQRDCGADCKSAGTTETSPGYNYIYVIEQLLSPPFPNYQLTNLKLAFTNENFCQDCIDNDNDCLIDCQDPDCNLPICLEPLISIIPEEVTANPGQIIEFQVIITNKLPKQHNITINKPELYNYSNMQKKPEWDSLIISYTNSTG